MRKMGIDPSRIKPTKTTFKGVIPGVEARCTGSITLEVVFRSPDNFQREELIFDIVPFRSGYHAILGRTAFTRFNAVPHYAYLKLKMPGPRGVITVNGNMDRSFRTEEHTAALAAEVQCGLLQQTTNLATATSSTVKRVRSTRNRITRHAKSATSSPASAQIPSKQHSCHAYTITHSKYQGHRQRRSSGSVNSAVSPQHTFITFPFTFQDIALVQSLQKSRIDGPT